jgi:hypothetical protein
MERSSSLRYWGVNQSLMPAPSLWKGTQPLRDVGDCEMQSWRMVAKSVVGFVWTPNSTRLDISDTKPYKTKRAGSGYAETKWMIHQPRDFGECGAILCSL